ncbi:MAG: hypothetical protein ACK4ON_04935 [Bacteroidia bacterium]
MLELTKHILQRVSFDKILFRKELTKALRWLKKDEALMLQAWCITTFSSEEFRAITREVFKKVVA